MEARPASFHRKVAVDRDPDYAERYTAESRVDPASNLEGRCKFVLKCYL
jgi:hypothetical protein